MGSSVSRLIVWLFVTVLALQLVTGGWARMRQWLSAKFIGVQVAA